MEDTSPAVVGFNLTFQTLARGDPFHARGRH
jgi:hypothetical protein